MKLDCTELPGRLREICEGRSGLPPEMEEAYRQLWIRQRTYGLGDLVADVIKFVTFGKLKPKPGCGCEKRREALNKIRLG